jgi:hypothetical protein
MEVQRLDCRLGAEHCCTGRNLGQAIDVWHRQIVPVSDLDEPEAALSVIFSLVFAQSQTRMRFICCNTLKVLVMESGFAVHSRGLQEDTRSYCTSVSWLHITLYMHLGADLQQG